MNTLPAETSEWRITFDFALEKSKLYNLPVKINRRIIYSKWHKNYYALWRWDFKELK
jgi:hypothetical protein